MEYYKYLLIACIMLCPCFRAESKEYAIIHIVTEKSSTSNKKYSIVSVNQDDIDQLNEPLRALAAYYGIVSGSNCMDHTGVDTMECELTTALGLGYYRSAKQVAVLNKWFPEDKEVANMLSDSYFVGSSSSSNFCNFTYLVFDVANDTVKIRYRVGCYHQGGGTSNTYNDIAVIGNSQIKFIKRGKAEISKNAPKIVDKCPLYRNPADTAITKGYLVKGDMVEVLQKQQDWVQIKYISPANGTSTIRWVRSDAVK